MNFNYLIVTLLVISIHQIAGRVLDRCELAQELLDQGISKKQLPNWVCIAEKESNGNTTKVRGPGKDGSYDYGLFLLSNNYWCAEGKPGNECNVDCEDLISDDITAVTECALKVFDVHGYSGWQSWGLKCKNNLPDLSECFESQE